MINRLRAVTLIAFTAVLTSLVSATAHAQKPALTENIDEKGLNPYYQLATTSTRCTAGDCVFDFNPVPQAIDSSSSRSLRAITPTTEPAQPATLPISASKEPNQAE